MKDEQQEKYWLSLPMLRQISVERAIEGFKVYDNLPITYWTTALMGEGGELCNMIKKLERVNNGGVDGGHSYTASSITKEMLEEEIGGMLLYLDLLASILKIDLSEAVIKTFNKKSEEYEWPFKLPIHYESERPSPYHAKQYAIRQFIGYEYGFQQRDIIEVVESMGLNADEWEQIKTEFEMPSRFKDCIDDYFTNK